MSNKEETSDTAWILMIIAACVVFGVLFGFSGPIQDWLHR